MQKDDDRTCICSKINKPECLAAIPKGGGGRGDGDEELEPDNDKNASYHSKGADDLYPLAETCNPGGGDSERHKRNNLGGEQLGTEGEKSGAKKVERPASIREAYRCGTLN